VTGHSSLRVLHVAQPTTAGVAQYVLAACADQVARGWDVAVACPEGGTLAGELVARDVRRLSWEAARSPGAGTPVEIGRVARIVRQVQPDIVHLHSAKAGLAGRLAIRSRIPTLFQPHGWSWLATSGLLNRVVTGWERFAVRWTDCLICVGEGEEREGRDRRVSAPFVIVRNGVDTASFTSGDVSARRTARLDLGLDVRAPIALCIGRLTRQKGQDVLLDAWEQLSQTVPEARLVFVGDGELSPALRARAPKSVIFSSAVRDVRPWYAAADVVVLPSRWEGLSLILLEAMASGRSVVVSDIAGLAEAVPYRAGARVGVGDVTALADAVTRRLRDPEVAAAEGRFAASYVRAEFDCRITLDHLAAITLVAAGRSTEGAGYVLR